MKENDYYLLQNGKKIDENSQIRSNLDVHLILRVNGGKGELLTFNCLKQFLICILLGGFGSMLKAIGAQIEKTTNREACRDLSGRRLRDINEEKRLKAYLEKLKEQPEDAEAQKIQKKIDKLLSKPKHEFKDAHYEKERSDLTEKIDEAVEQGFKKAFATASTELPQDGGESSSHGVKRKIDNDSKAKKKKKGALW